jgi:cytochrome c oxidase subunit 1
MPRRYATYASEFQVLNVMSTAGASILGIGYMLPLIYLGWAWFKGPKSPQNPWHAKGLEWEQAPTPPPTLNFDVPPVVTEPAYNYAGEVEGG